MEIHLKMHFSCTWTWKLRSFRQIEPCVYIWDCPPSVPMGNLGDFSAQGGHKETVMFPTVSRELTRHSTVPPPPKYHHLFCWSSSLVSPKGGGGDWGARALFFSRGVRPGPRHPNPGLNQKFTNVYPGVNQISVKIHYIYIAILHPTTFESFSVLIN